MRKKPGTIGLPVGGADEVLIFDTNSGHSPTSLLTIGDVATLLKISSSGVRRLQHQRKLPFIKVGGSVRFHEADITSYLRKQRVEAVG